MSQAYEIQWLWFEREDRIFKCHVILFNISYNNIFWKSKQFSILNFNVSSDFDV